MLAKRVIWEFRFKIYFNIGGYSVMFSSVRNCTAGVALAAVALVCVTFATDGRAQPVGSSGATGVANQTVTPTVRSEGFKEQVGDLNAFLNSPLNFGVSAGVALDSGPSVNSSSAFYRGGTDSFGAPYVNAFANVPITTLGPFAVRFGGMIETMPGTLSFSGTAGGVPTTSSGSLWQTNFLATLPLVTPISQNFLFSVAPVAGFGLLKPTGNPGGPFFTGTDTAFVAGFDLSLLQPVSPNVVIMYNVGYRHTAPTSFNTTLVGERYNVGGDNKIMFSVSILLDNILQGTSVPAPRRFINTLDNGMDVVHSCEFEPRLCEEHPENVYTVR